MNDTVAQDGFTGRCQNVLQVARDLHQRRPDWITFFRETLGVNGAARSVFPDQEHFVRFEQSPEYAEIQSMVTGLRNAKIRGGKDEATRVITVRLPESLHEALKAEASDHHTSMNRLCISKLLQVLSEAETEPPKGANSRTTPQPQTIAEPAAERSAMPPSAPSPAAASFRSTWNSGE